jgi:signal transduction histidine kinase
LGLSLVYGIVENHGGRIKAFSEPEQGARFVIELPITPRADGDRARE